MAVSERVAGETLNPVGMIASVSGIGSYYSDPISLDCDTGRKFVALVNTGTIGSSGTVDFTFATSTTAQGTYTAYSASAITQLTQSGDTGTKLSVVEVSTEAVKAAVSGAKYLKGYLKTLTAATPCSVTIIAVDPAHKPIPTAKMTSYLKEIVPAAGTNA